MSSTGATLSGSYSGVVGTVIETGFVWGLSSNALSNKAVASGTGSFAANLSNLNPETTYYYKAYTVVKGTGDYSSHTKTFYGSVASFKTKADVVAPSGWLELPSQVGTTTHFYDNFGTGKGRNYSYCYDKVRHASLWTAYPLTKAHTQGSGHTSSWRWNPNLDKSLQVDIVSGGYGTNYGNDTYSRGHMCPNADRKSDDAQNGQTFYPTNQVPQIQNGFNSGIWSNLENAIRGLTASTDTIYIAVGPCYRKVGGSETIKHLTGKSGVNPSSVDIPNYFYKVLLKVKWNGGKISSACAVGFWFEHKTYDNSANAYASYAVSVDRIEEWTGIDFFANLPASAESVAESNTNWTTFSSF